MIAPTKGVRSNETSLEILWSQLTTYSDTGNSEILSY